MRAVSIDTAALSSTKIISYHCSSIYQLFISVIHIFDLVPGASRQSEPNSIQTKMQIKQIAVSRAGKYDDQYIVFIDANRDLFGAEIKSDFDFEIEKIGTQLLNVIWGSESNILVGLHDACYSIWYCPGESWTDPIIMALSTITVDIT